MLTRSQRSSLQARVIWGEATPEEVEKLRRDTAERDQEALANLPALKAASGRDILMTASIRLARG